MTKVTIIVTEEKTGAPISGAPVTVDNLDKGTTNEQGVLVLDLAPGTYSFEATAFGMPVQATHPVNKQPLNIPLKFNFQLSLSILPEIGTIPIEYANQGDVVRLHVEHPLLSTGSPLSPVGSPTSPLAAGSALNYTWTVRAGTIVETDQNRDTVHWHTFGAAGIQTVSVTIKEAATNTSVTVEKQFNVLKTSDFQSTDTVPVSLRRTQVTPTDDQALWVAIRNRTKAISFSGSGYEDFINRVLCEGIDTSNIIPERNRAALNRQRNELYDPIHGVGAYELLKTATQIFLLLECGAVIRERDRYIPDDRLFDPNEETIRLGRTITLGEAQARLTTYLGEGRLPYINRVLDTAFKGRDLRDSIFCDGVVLSSHANCPPMLELIWSYWHEEGMLVQTMNAVSLRFQNRRSKSSRDPLAHLEIAPLHPVNNLLWGYLQDEIHRLSLARRNYEYSHHYGLGLYGQAVADFRPADPRSKFLEGFHNLLYLTTLFYKQADDTTVIPDGFPILNALREVHLVLAEGAHNQFGDLPWTARSEMLMQQWLLARPEMREFLQSRAMVPYRESWMAQVDTMKYLQGWTDVSVTHFNYLAVYGEQILLSIRYGDWIDAADPAQAANWALYWRPEIQGYIHAYRTVTGVDLSAEIRTIQQRELIYTKPSALLHQRLSDGRSTPALPAGQVLPALPAGNDAAAPQGFRQRRAARRLTSDR